MTSYRTLVMAPNSNPNAVAIAQDMIDSTQSTLIILASCCFGTPAYNSTKKKWVCGNCNTVMIGQPSAGCGGPKYWVTSRLDADNCALWASRWVGLGARNLRVNLTYPPVV